MPSACSLLLAVLGGCMGTSSLSEAHPSAYVPPAATGAGFSILDTFAIHRIHHSAFPRAVALPSGEVLVVFRRGTEHLVTDGRLMLARLRRTSDGWKVSDPTTVFDTELDERNFGIARLADGTLVINLCSTDAFPAGSGSRITVLRSHDEGVTWGDRVDYTAASLPGNESSVPWFGTNSPIVELADGSLVMPVDGVAQGSPFRSAHLLRSRDRGLSWRYDRALADDADRGIGYAEASLVVTPLGVTAALRSSGTGTTSPDDNGMVFTARADPRAEVWTRPGRTTFWGYPQNLLRTSRGTLVMTYGYRRSPIGVAVRVSRDEGATWDVPGDGRLAVEGEGPDSGYPSTVELPDGTLLTTYYVHRLDTGVYVKAVHWQLE